MVIRLETDSLKQILRSSEKTMVMYSAPWCGGCKKIKPMFEKYAKMNPHIPFVEVNTDISPMARALVDVTHIPMFVPFIGAEPLTTEYGAKEDIIKNLVNLL